MWIFVKGHIDSDMLQLVGNHETTADQPFRVVISMSSYNIVWRYDKRSW